MSPTPAARLPRILVILALLGLPGACAGDAAGPDATDAGADGDVADGAPEPYEPPLITWAPCTDEPAWQCGELLVPRSYTEPEGPTFRQAVRRLPASDPGTRIGVLLVNPGGPGAGAAGYALELAERPEVTERFDLVALDPRATGGSEPTLDCWTDEDMDALRATSPATDPDGALALALHLRDGCAELGADVLGAIGTTDVAQDMDTLRRALGEEQINYFGTSYGTFLGAVYASLFPDRARAFVLDAALTPRYPDPRILFEQARAFEAEYDRFFAICAVRDECPLAGGQGDEAVREAWAALVADVEAGQVDGPDGPLAINDLLGVMQAVFSSGSSQGIANIQVYSSIVSILQPVREGHGSEVVALADSLNGRDPSGHYLRQSGSHVAHVAIVCRDGLAGMDEAAFDDLLADVSTYAPEMANSIWDYRPCVGWAAPPSTPIVSAPEAPPMLVLAGLLDPATPYPWASELVAALDNGSAILTWNGDGHVSSSRGTVFTRIARFLVHPEDLDVDPLSCPRDALTFDALVQGEVGGTAAATVELRDAANDELLDEVQVTDPRTFQLHWPGASSDGWAVVRMTMEGTRPLRSYFRIVANRTVGTLNPGLSPLVPFDEELGLASLLVRDCDGQAVQGARVVLGEDVGRIVYRTFSAEDVCFSNSAATELSDCGGAFAVDLPPGTYTLGFDLDDRAIAGPDIVVEDRGSVVVVLRP